MSIILRKILIASAVFCCSITLACRNVEVSESDKNLFVRFSDLTKYGFHYEKGENLETFEKIAYIDFSTEIAYTFETPENEESPLYLSETLSLEPRKSGAMTSKGIDETVVTVGLKAGGIEAEEIKNFYKYGDASSFYVLKKDGNKVGNYFVMREGKKTFSILITGIYIDQADVWRELVEPKLKNISNYSGKQ